MPPKQPGKYILPQEKKTTRFKVEVFVNYLREGGFRGFMYEWCNENDEWGDSIDFHIKKNGAWEEMDNLRDEQAIKCLNRMREAVIDEIAWRKVPLEMQDRHMSEGLVYSEEVPIYA